MVKAVTQTAPDVEIGWSRRRHASRRRSGGVRHNKINQNTKKLTDKPEKPEFFPKGVIYGLQESQDNLDEIANEIGATYMHRVGDPNNSKTTLVAFEKNTNLPPFVEIDNRKYKISFPHQKGAINANYLDTIGSNVIERLSLVVVLVITNLTNATTTNHLNAQTVGRLIVQHLSLAQNI